MLLIKNSVDECAHSPILRITWCQSQPCRSSRILSTVATAAHARRLPCPLPRRNRLLYCPKLGCAEHLFPNSRSVAFLHLINNGEKCPARCTSCCPRTGSLPLIPQMVAVLLPSDSTQRFPQSHHCLPFEKMQKMMEATIFRIPQMHQWSVRWIPTNPRPC